MKDMSLVVKIRSGKHRGEIFWMGYSFLESARQHQFARLRGYDAIIVDNDTGRKTNKNGRWEKLKRATERWA